MNFDRDGQPLLLKRAPTRRTRTTLKAQSYRGMCVYSYKTGIRVTSKVQLHQVRTELGQGGQRRKSKSLAKLSWLTTRKLELLSGFSIQELITTD